MKKIILVLTVLSAASLSFAGGDKACADKEKCDAKCEKPCCKAEKSSKACCTEKTAAKKVAATTDKTEKK